MRRVVTSRTATTATLAAGVAILTCGVAPSGALAAGVGHAPALPVASLGSLLGGLASTVLGGVSWTVNLAGSFILNLIGGLVKLLIPRSWIHQGLQILGWVVAVPDYTGRIAGPGGTRVYGFPGVNAMRGLYTWLGIAILPLTVVYATVRAATGQGDHVAVPLIRVVTVSIGVLSYSWLWGQAVALSNWVTTVILGLSAVTQGIYKMFTLLVSGSVLVGLPLVGELLLAAAGVGLLAMIFVKVVLILAGALVYAIGPLMIGLAPTERGHAIARAWASLTVALFTIGILWASIFAIAAVLLNDAGGGALLLGGGTSVGRLFGGVVIAMAAIAGFYTNLKLTKAIGGVIAGQLAGVLAQVGGHGGIRGLLGGAQGGGAAMPGPAGGGVASLRGFAAKLGGGAAGAAGALAPGARAGALLAAGAGAGGALARGGLIGAGGALAAHGLAGAARSNLGRAAGATRAGALATRIARGGRGGWSAAAASTAAGGAGGLLGGASAANQARRAVSDPSPKTPAAAPVNGTPAATPRGQSGAAPITPAGAGGARPGAPTAAVPGGRPTRAGSRPGGGSPPPGPVAPSPAPGLRRTPPPGPPGSSPFAQRPTRKPGRWMPRPRKGPRS